MKKQDESVQEIARSTDGGMYTIDPVNHTCRKIHSPLDEFKNIDEMDIPEMSLVNYANYLKDHFDGETVSFKNNKIRFRGYAITLTMEDGLVIRDTNKKNKVVETGMEGIPTPKELGDWFTRPKKELTDAERKAEYDAAVEAGKKAEEARKKAREIERKVREQDAEPVDFEKCRKQVLDTIEGIRNKTITDFDAKDFLNMIPFKRWRRQCKALYVKRINGDIRYAKFLKELERITTEETFVVEEKRHRSAFKGTFLPEHKRVGYLRGDKLEVDNKLVEAVPFLLEYLLHYEPRAMSQIMKYAAGTITDVELIENPIDVDWKVEYNKKALPNTAHNAQVLTCVYESCGIAAPQDLLYDSDLKAGDVILLMIDGKMRRRVVNNTEREVVLGKEVGLLKTDKWIKAPIKEKESK